MFRKEYTKWILFCLSRRYEHFDIRIISFRFELRNLCTFKIEYFENERERKFNIELGVLDAVWKCSLERPLVFFFLFSDFCFFVLFRKELKTWSTLPISTQVL